MGPRPGPGGGRARGRSALPWPSRQSNKILEANTIVHVADVAHTLWVAWQLKGNPDAVLRSVDIWLDAAEKIDKSEESLSASRDDLVGLWEGGAFEAYDRYTDRNIKVTDLNTAALSAASGFLVDMYLAVITAYNESVNYVVQAGIKVESIIGVFTGNENAQEKQTLETELTNLVINITQRHNNLRSVLGGYRGNLARMKGEQIKLRKPLDIPPAATDRGRWERA